MGRDSEFAYSADLSTRILRFGKLEAEGGLRKILRIKLRDTNIVEKKRQKSSPTKGLVMVRSGFSITCGMVVQTIPHVMQQLRNMRRGRGLKMA